MKKLSANDVRWIRNHAGKVFRLSDNECVLLLKLLSTENFNYAELAKDIGVTRQAATQAAQRFERAELVVITRVKRYAARADAGRALRAVLAASTK